MFDLDSFDVEVPTGGALADFIEFAPDSVDLKARPELGRARMRISLDLLEMLELIRSGYRPSVNDLRGLFVNLQMFRNELLSLPFDRIVVAREDDVLFNITGAPNHAGEICLSLIPYATPDSQGAQP